MIALLGRGYDRLARRVGQSWAGALVLGLGCLVSLVLVWALGGEW